jgi:hypothetical protein
MHIVNFPYDMDVRMKNVLCELARNQMKTIDLFDGDKFLGDRI